MDTKILNNAVWVLKPLIKKGFTKDGLNDDELETMFNLLLFLDIEFDIYEKYLDYTVFNIVDDDIDLIIEKINSVKLII